MCLPRMVPGVEGEDERPDEPRQGDEVSRSTLCRPE